MKIGIVCHSTLGGSGVIATELGEALGERGHDVHLICAGHPVRLRKAKLHTVDVPTHELFPAGDLALGLASKLIDLAPNFDVLHVHYGIPHAVSAALAKQALGKKAPKWVTTVHGTDVLTLGKDAGLQPVLKHALHQCDVVTAPTRFLASEAKTIFDIEVEVIGNFVDLERFKPSPPRRRTLVHNSNFRPLKRVEDVVSIYAAVLQRTNAELVLIGDGPTRPEIEKLARARGVRVDFVGEQVNVSEFLHGASAFLFPSEIESFGLAALEAMACGVPVIASQTGGLPELVEDGKTGFLRPVGDVAGMAERAAALLNDDALFQRLSTAAREAAEKSWNRDLQVDRYEALYRKLLECSNSP